MKTWKELFKMKKMKTVDLYQQYAIQNRHKKANGILEIYCEASDCDKSIIVCPGGGYSGLADHEGEPIAKKFADLGYRTFILKYSCAPVSFPFALTEGLCAVDYVKKHYGGQVGILGFSAGGHLTGSVVTLFNKDFALTRIAERTGLKNEDFFDRRADFGIMCYPVVSEKPELIHQGSFDNLRGKDNDDLCGKLSLEEQVDCETPPVFFWHTVADQCVPYRNSVIMSEALEKIGTKTMVQLYSDGHHGLGLAESWDDVKTWPEICNKFIRAL